jgi:phage major head subunit gpT-like protein
VTYTHTEFADGFQVERALLDDMQYEGIFTSASQMGTAFARKQEKDAWSAFNNAFSSSYLGYDSKALCADDHPQSETDSTAVDNKSVAVLSDDALEDAIVQLQGLGDDRGEEISVMPNLLIVPRALRKTAFQLTESELTPEDANTAANVHEGMQFMVVPWLTSTTAWFVVDTAMSKTYLKWYDRIDTEFAAEDSFDTFMRKYRGYMRYSFGWSDFRWLVGSTGAG